MAQHRSKEWSALASLPSKWVVVVAFISALGLSACELNSSLEATWPPMQMVPAAQTEQAAQAAQEVSSQDAEKEQKLVMQYNAAVHDALTVEDDELFPVVSLKQGEPFVTYDQQGRVLLLTVHHVPEVFVAGQQDELKMATWTFTDKEFAAWLSYILATNQEPADWTVRVNQLLGMPHARHSTLVSALWVWPQDIKRPAYTTDIFTTKMSASFQDPYANHDPDYQTWFNGNIISSYFSGYDYPWTRLGYTYDWGSPSTEYGLSEFLVRVGAPFEVAYTMPIMDFVEHMKQQVKQEEQEAPEDQ